MQMYTVALQRCFFTSGIGLLCDFMELLLKSNHNTKLKYNKTYPLCNIRALVFNSNFFKTLNKRELKSQ